MSGLTDEASRQANARRPPAKHPEGWEPGVAWDGRTGTITAPSDSRLPDWRGLLTMWDFDPDQYEVVEPVQIRTWDAAIGNGEVRRMWYHRAAIRRRIAGAPDVDQLVALIRRRGPSKQPTASSIEGVYFLCHNDWQIGKTGTEATIQRIKDGIDASVRRIAELRKIGRRIDAIYLPGLGDLPEATSGHYPAQPYMVELNGRAQARVARELLTYSIDQHVNLAARIAAPAIAGNHGEKRTDGKATTDPGDNVDLEIYENVGEALAKNPARYGHVSVSVPESSLTMTVQPIADGPIVGLAHGHTARGAKGRPTVDAGPLGKIIEWWKGQEHGRRAIGDADVLLVGHFHQYLIHEDGPRTLVIAPTVDSGSPWFAESVGVDSKPGMFSFLLTRDGVRDPQVL